MAKKQRKQRAPSVLYSIWDNKTDRLLILDGTAEECCKLLGIKRESFYHFACVAKSFTIQKTSVEAVQKEVES